MRFKTPNYHTELKSFRQPSDVYPECTVRCLLCRSPCGGCSAGGCWVLWRFSAPLYNFFQIEPKLSFPFIFPHIGWQPRPEHSLTSPPGMTATFEDGKRRGVACASLPVSHQSAVQQPVLALGFTNKFEKISLVAPGIISHKGFIWRKGMPDSPAKDPTPDILGYT